MNILLVALGGALGAVSRYLFGLTMMKKYPEPPFPIAMLCVNVIGSLGLGLFFAFYYGVLPLARAYDDAIFLFLGIGFFGAFTTFSTFSVETVQLIEKNLYKKAIIYVSLSIVGSIFAFILGFFGVLILI